MDIYQSLTAIMKEIGHIGKEKKSTQGYAYRGVDQVLNTLQPLLAENKVFCVPEVLEVIGREDRQTKNGGTQIYSILKVKYTFYAEDGSNVSAVVMGEAMDSGDKSMNKCMSVAFKYACFQTLCIPTEETTQDPDDKSEQFEPEKTDKPKATEKPFKAPTAAQLDKIKNYNGTLEQIATYLKKTINEVSYYDVEKILIKKRNAAKEAEEKTIRGAK